MANQAIALQARAPQGNFLAPAIQQGAQLINMMSQQRAAERQAAVQQQQMDMQRASAAREAELQPDRVKKAAYEALSSQQKAVLEFFDLAAEGVKQSRTPEDAVKIGQFLKSSFNSPELQGIVDQTLSSMPSDPALWPEWKKQTELQSLDSKDRLTEEFTTQNLGTSTRIVATPKYGGGVARVVPSSEVDLGQEVTYVRGGDGSIRAMPKRLPVGGGGGGLVGGVRGGEAAGNVQMGQPIAGTGKPAAAAKPKAGEISPEKKLARDRAVQDLYDAVVEAQKKGHLVSDKQSYMANRAQELRQGRAYLPGGTEQKSSVDTIEATAAQLLRQLIEKGTSGTLNALGEQKLFLRSVGGADSTYETRMKTIRNFAKQNGIALNDYADDEPQASGAKTSAPPSAAIQMLRKNPTPAERKLFDSVFGAGAAAKALEGR